ncbi:MAG: alpha/beta fold hydrolase [Rubrimonas sp.]|uniref:alpha/beta fold hydrolase n=1 Tax=Rubrimonas sp. TaxID=2036015 RepID=UPI002FDCF558
MPSQPPLLFLHGAFAGPEIWTRFVAPWFARRGRVVSAPRLAPPGARGVRLRALVAAARAAADALEAPPVLIGHSLGGLVAQHLAAERRVAGLILVAAPGPFGLGPSLWRLSARHPRVLAALMLTQIGGGGLLGVEAARRALFTEDTPEDWIAEVAPVPRPESPQALFDGLTWDWPVWPLVRRSPVLALLGDRDAFIPVSDLAAIALSYGARTEILHGMAHGAPIDPRWLRLAWAIETWLQEREALEAGKADAAVGRLTE